MLKKNWFTQNAEQLSQIFGSAAIIGTVCLVGLNLTSANISSKTNTTIAFSLLSFISLSLITGYYNCGYQHGQWAGLAELLTLTIRCKKLENQVQALQLQLAQIRLTQPETLHYPSPETSTTCSDNDYDIVSEHLNNDGYESPRHIKSL